MDRYLILLIGNIASGKSRFSKKLSKAGFVCVSSDGIRYMFHPDEYKFDNEEEYAVHEVSVTAVTKLMELGKNICLDNAGNSIKDRRTWAIDLAKQNGYRVVAVKLPFVSKHLSVKRRLKDNHGKYDRARWEQVYDMFQKTNCPPTLKEGFYGVYSHSSADLRRLLSLV